MARRAWVAECEGKLLGAFGSKKQAEACEQIAADNKALFRRLLNSEVIEEVEAGAQVLPEGPDRMQLFAHLIYLEDLRDGLIKPEVIHVPV